MQKRLVGLTIVGVLMFIGVLEYVVMAIMGAVSPDRMRDLLEGVTPGGMAGPAVLLKLGAFLPVYFLAMAILTGFIARAFWQLKNWARLLVIVLGAISVLIGAVELIQGASAMGRSAIGFAIIRLAIPGLIVWYLSRPKVRASFSGLPPAGSDRT
jgi:hypothetical protein